jgi:hypothetical protein
VVRLRRPDQLCSVDQSIYGHLKLRSLAVLAEERSDMAGAAECSPNAQATMMLWPLFSAWAFRVDGLRKPRRFFARGG